MDASEQGDISINICCCTDGAASVFTTICNGEYKKDVQMETMSTYIDKEGKASIQEMERVEHTEKDLAMIQSMESEFEDKGMG